MDKSDLTRYKLIIRQALKSLVVLTLTLPALMLLVATILVGALAILTGQSDVDVSYAFLSNAVTPITMVSLQLMLAMYCIAAIYSVVSRDNWTVAHPHQLVARLYARVIGLTRLWASLASTIATPLYPQHSSHRRVALWNHGAAILTTPYLAGEAPQLE